LSRLRNCLARNSQVTYETKDPMTMPTTTLRALSLLMLACSLVACDQEELYEDDEPSPEEVFGASWRGWGFGSSSTKLNTNVVNGSAVDTVRFGLPTSYGQTVTDVYVNGFGWLEDDIDTLEVVDGALRASKNGQQIVAHAFEGSIWFLEVNGEFAWMQLEDVRYASEVGLANYGAKSMTNLDPDRLVYKWYSPTAPPAGTAVDPKTGQGGLYDGYHTCPDDTKSSTWSVLSRGLLVNGANGDVADTYWAPNQYAYFACLSGAVGKTMLWGYSHDNPAGGMPNVSLSEYESALRATRADYCGDGKSYTRPGEAVTIVDKWGINEHSNEAINDEAVFGSQGALCVDNPRWEYFQGPIQCSDGTVIPSCKTLKFCVGSPFWKCYYDYAQDVFEDHSDALIWTRNASF
jgi:hypothetical protein